MCTQVATTQQQQQPANRSRTVSTKTAGRARAQANPRGVRGRGRARATAASRREARKNAGQNDWLQSQDMVLLGDGDEPSGVWRGAPPKRGRGPPQRDVRGRGRGRGRARTAIVANGGGGSSSENTSDMSSDSDPSSSDSDLSGDEGPREPAAPILPEPAGFDVVASCAQHPCILSRRRFCLQLAFRVAQASLHKQVCTV